MWENVFKQDPIYFLIKRNERLLRSIEKRFNIHPLVISDVECDEQRTKIDVLDDAFFIALKLIYRDTVHNQIFVEQISFYMIENVLITFEKHPHRIFDSIKSKLIAELFIF